MKVKIELEINRTSGRDDDRPISVRIGDSISGCRFLEANFRLDDFMEILTGRVGITGEGEYYPDTPVGCTQESKEEIIRRPKSAARPGPAFASTRVISTAKIYPDLKSD